MLAARTWALIDFIVEYLPRPEESCAADGNTALGESRNAVDHCRRNDDLSRASSWLYWTARAFISVTLVLNPNNAGVFMSTFSDILKALPSAVEEQPPLLKNINIFMAICFSLAVILAAAGWFWDKIFLFYTAFVPLALLPLALVLQQFLEMRRQRKMFGDSAGWIADWLDKRFEEEKHVVSDFDKEKLPELKHMLYRLDSEIVTREKWMEVLKPFSMLIPAVLIVVASDFLKVPDGFQGVIKLMGGAMLSGFAIGAISISTGIVKLRRLSSTLHYAVNAADQKKKPEFLKVSRKRNAK
jgi:hypothetical protein